MLQLTSLFIVILSILLILLIPGCSGKGKVGGTPKKKNNGKQSGSKTKTGTKTDSTQSTDNKTPPGQVTKPFVPVQPPKIRPVEPVKTPEKPLENIEKVEKPSPKVKKVSPKKPEAPLKPKKMSKKKPEKSTALMDLPTANDGKDAKPKPKVSNKKSMYLEEAVKKEEVKPILKKPSFQTLPTQTSSFREDPLESSAKRHRDQVKPGELNEYSDDTIEDAPSIPRKEGNSCSTERSLENVTKKPSVGGEMNQKVEKKISVDEVVEEKK